MSFSSGVRSVVSGVRSVVAWASSLRHLSLLSIIPITAHAHWHLGVQLGMPEWLAPLLPVALDSYVLASFRAWEVQATLDEQVQGRGRRRVRVHDLIWALTLDMVAVAGSHAAAQMTLTALEKGAIGAALGVLLVLTLWRVHALDVGVNVQVKSSLRGRAGSAPRVDPGAAAEPESGVTVTPAEVSPEVSAAPRHEPSTSEPVATEGSSLVDVAGPVNLDRWVAHQIEGGARFADVIPAGGTRFGVSESTVKRRWNSAKKVHAEAIKAAAR